MGRSIVRSMAGLSAKTPSVKSGLSKCLKWSFEDGTFALKVPASDETRELRDVLWSQGQPAASYFAPGGAIVAWQWRLRCDDYRSIWTSKTGVKRD